MNAYLEIIRPGNAIMADIAVILVAIIGQNYNIPIILGIITVFLATSGGNVINDYFDYQIDSINRPQRPIPSGKISLEKARIYAFFLFILSILIGLLINHLINNFIPGLIVLLSSLLMYYYAHTLKSTPLIGNIVISVLTGLCFIFAGTIISLDTSSFEIINTSFYLGFFATMMTFSRELTKDMEDLEGDSLEGANTFPIIYGNKLSSVLTTVFMVLSSVLSPILYFNKIFSFYYLLILLIAIFIFLYGAYMILKSQTPDNCKKVSKMIKIGMIITFLAFAVGSL